MPDWNELFKQDDLVLTEAHPAAGRFIGLLAAGSRVLDLGCGAGRHLGPLLTAGHSVVGIDSAFEGLKRARDRMGKAFPKARVPLLLATMLDLPFAEKSFDGVLTVNVLNHGTADEMLRVLGEIHRMLRPGGLCCAVVISDEDSRCGRGERIEERTFVPTEGIEAGIPHHYSNKDDLLEWSVKVGWSESRFELLKKGIDEAARSEQGIIPLSWGKPVEVVAHWEMVLRK